MTLQSAAAVIFVIISLLFVYTKRLPTIINSLYLTMLIAGLLSTTFDIASTYVLMGSKGQTSLLSDVLDILYSSTVIFITALIFFLAYFSFSGEKGITRRNFLLALIPLPLLCFATVPAASAYQYTTAGLIDTGARSIVTLVSAFVYVLATIAVVAIKARKVHRTIFVTFSIVVGIELLTAAVLIATGVTNVISFAVSLVCVSLFFSIENPNMSLNNKTKIFNRQGLSSMLQHLFALKEEFSVITIHFDDYRSICIAFGVSAADNYIAEIAKKIEKVPNLTAFITKRDELNIIYQGDKQKATEHAYGISFFLNGNCNIMGKAIASRYKITVFDCPEKASTPSAVYDLIEYTLEEIKESKTSRVLIYEKNLVDHQIRKSRIQAIISEALQKGDGLNVHYQTICDAKTKEIVSAEALVRLEDRSLGFLSPEEFVPIAEKSGHIIALGTVVFEKVCQFVRKYNLDNSGMKLIEINLSGVQCNQVNLADELITIMNRYEIRPSFINLEITETSAMESQNMLTQNMNRLIEKGVSFSLDDFGAGFSNILYITNFPFSAIKLDKYLVWSYFDENNKKSKTILEAVVKMIKRINLKVIAEGVETQEQVDALSEMGVDELQGFYFSRPIEEKLFLSLLREKNILSPETPE